MTYPWGLGTPENISSSENIWCVMCPLLQNKAYCNANKLHRFTKQFCAVLIVVAMNHVFFNSAIFVHVKCSLGLLGLVESYILSFTEYIRHTGFTTFIYILDDPAWILLFRPQYSRQWINNRPLLTFPLILRFPNFCHNSSVFQHFDLCLSFPHWAFTFTQVHPNVWRM